MRTESENLLNAMITQGWALEEGGHVEGPSGYYAVVRVPDAGTLKEYAEELDVDVSSVDLELGRWHVVITDQQGFIHYVSECCKHFALAMFAELEAEYAAWAEDKQDAIADASGGTWGD